MLRSDWFYGLFGSEEPATFLTQCRLKYWTSRSCCFAFSSESKVPRLRRFPVEGSVLREYKRYWPDLSFRITAKSPDRHVISYNATV